MNVPGVISSGWLSKDGKHPPAFLVVLASLVTIAALIPVVYLFVRSVNSDSEWTAIIFRASTVEVFARTFLLIALVSLFL